MDIKQINSSLNQILYERNKRIIFWYDEDEEFAMILPMLDLGEAKLLRMDEFSSLELKIRLELEDPEGKYVLYAPYPEPGPEDDWLFDIKLYSELFRADPASMILKELNIDRQSLRPHIQARKTFFRNQDRLNRLKKWITAEDHEDDLDLKMLAVIVRAEQPEPFAILMKLINSFCKSGQYDDSEASRPWEEIEKLGLAPSFWKMLGRHFGYVRDSEPGITNFLLHVFVTDLANNIQTDLPASLSQFRITASQAMNSSVFLAGWRSHTAYLQCYREVSHFMARKLKIEEFLTDFEVEDLLEVMTFAAVEKRIISAVRDQIIRLPENGFDRCREIIRRRLDGYWATTALMGEEAGNLYKTVYKALDTAIDLLEIRRDYDGGFSRSSAADLFTAYTREIFLFDQRYRIFNELADQAELGGWDVLKELRDRIEDVYSGWFMTQLSLKWGDFLEPEHPDNLLERWKIPEVTNQYDFYDKSVRPVLESSARKRIFVIISDAFRYEAADELAGIINSKYRLKADLQPMLGSLPGYTGLGMASLLPHREMTFTSGGEITVDGQPAASIQQRSQILARYEGCAVKAEELLAMSKDKGREFVKPYRVIYIYHDHIDAIGDKPASESNTFEAVRKTINELYSLISFIINSLNGTHVMITADHGFIYQEKAPEPIDKSSIQSDISGAVRKHKRFVLGVQPGGQKEHGNVFSGNTKITAKTEDDMYFLLPKSTNRFNFVGGARFFHGGAMLQEAVLPLISISEMKGKHLEASEVRHVGVSLYGSYKKLLTNRPIYKFIQTDPVSDRVRPLTLKISLRDGNDLISNEETVTFDSTSSSLDERQKSVRLVLKTGSYDNKKEYALVLRHTDDTEYDRVPVIIDIAIANDF
ncbi:MAG: BREX-1 system phosphatase PglZ type A [Desulfurivibrionaceae bacterium]